MERPLRIGSRDLNAEKTHTCTFEGIALQVADGAKGSRSASGLVWVRGRRQRLWGFDERPGTEQCHCCPRWTGNANQEESPGDLFSCKGAVNVLGVLRSVEMRVGNLGGECKDGASWLWAPGWRG